MFIPNLDCWIRKVTGYNADGEEILAPKVLERCAIVRYRKELFHTTVRADSSATRGYADENRADIIVLLQPDTQGKIGDQLELQGMKVRIVSSFPRHNHAGVLEHNEVTGEFWE
jgi:hypothetical protein